MKVIVSSKVTSFTSSGILGIIMKPESILLKQMIEINKKSKLCEYYHNVQRTINITYCIAGIGSWYKDLLCYLKTFIGLRQSLHPFAEVIYIYVKV